MEDYIPGNRGLHCSFCGKSQDQVGKLVAGPNGVFICDECIEACREMLAESGFGLEDEEP